MINGGQGDFSEIREASNLKASFQTPGTKTLLNMNEMQKPLLRTINAFLENFNISSQWKIQIQFELNGCIFKRLFYYSSLHQG